MIPLDRGMIRGLELGKQHFRVQAPDFRKPAGIVGELSGTGKFDSKHRLFLNWGRCCHNVRIGNPANRMRATDRGMIGAGSRHDGNRIEA